MSTTYYHGVEYGDTVLLHTDSLLAFQCMSSDSVHAVVLTCLVCEADCNTLNHLILIFRLYGNHISSEMERQLGEEFPGRVKFSLF